MNTISCPECGQQATAFGSVTSCGCDKMYCDHVQGLFREYSCKHCGASGATPQYVRFKEHQFSKIQADVEREARDLLVGIQGKVKSTFSTESVSVVGSELQVAFSNGCCATVTVTNPYSSPAEFQVVSNDDTQKARNEAQLRQTLAAIAAK